MNVENKVNIENKVNVEGFQVLQKSFSKSTIYKIVYEIENVFVTSVLLFHSALHANNNELVTLVNEYA